MACIVYREGTGTVEHGIECESTTCEVNELHSLLNAGWSQTPPGYVPPEPVSVEEQDLDSTITPPGSGENVLQPEVDRLTAEVEDLGLEVANLQKQISIHDNIEANLQETIAKLKADLATAQQIETHLNGEVSKLSKLLKDLQPSANAKPDDDLTGNEEGPEVKDLDPVRAAGRDAGIEGWETMHLSSLKKALKELEA